MDNKLLDKLGAFASKMDSNNVLQGISRGVMGVLPVIIVGAFASLFVGLPIPAWQSFIASTGLNTALSMLANGASGMLGVFVCASVAHVYADRLGLKAKAINILALVLYFGLLPFGQNDELGTFLPVTYLGTQGMIIGILLALLAVHIYKFVIDRNIVIKMPAGTPPYVSDSFTALIPAFAIAVVTLVLRMVFAATLWGSAFDFVYAMLQAPLQSIVGDNIWTIILLYILFQLVWVFGIHGGFITGTFAPILFGLDAMNQAAFAAGQAIPNVIGMAFSYSMTTAVFYPALAVAALLCKSENLKTVGKISVVPAFFGISEPLVFGIPVVFNPIMFVPFVFTPAINLLLGYGAISLGLVPAYAGVTVFNVPMIATGLMNGSLALAILEVVLFVLDVALILPFMRVQDKRHLAEEAAAAEDAE